MKKTLLLGAFAAMLAIPAMQAESVELFVKDATSVTSPAGTNPLSYYVENGKNAVDNLQVLVINGYSFKYDSKDTKSTKAPQLTKTTAHEWEVSLRLNNESYMTITAPGGTYMTGITFMLSPISNACPPQGSYTITDAAGTVLDGEFSYSGEYNEVVTWKGSNKGGYPALRLVFYGNKSMRCYEYVISLPEETGDTYEDLFKLAIGNGAYIKAGVATNEAGTFGKLGCTFNAAPSVNTACTDKVNLVYNGNVVRSWGVDSEDIVFTDDNAVYFTGVTALEVLNPGDYSFSIPRGFFKVGDVLSNGANAIYHAQPNVLYSHMARIVEPNSQSREFNKVKIVNVNLTSEPVITDSFHLFARMKHYYKESAHIEDGAVVVWLDNPTSDPATYNIYLDEGSIAWPLDEDTYCYSNEFDSFPVTISGPVLTIAAESPYGTNDIEVTWTNPTGSFTEGYIRYNNESVALTAAQLASGAQQTATITVEKGNWYDVSMVFYGSGTVESNHETVWAGPAVNIHNPIDFTSEQWYSRRERGTEWIVLPFADFENNQTYEVNVTGRSTESSGYSFLLYIGYTQDTAEMVQYGTFSGLNNAKSNAITLHAEDMVTPGDVYAAAYAEEGQLHVQYGGLFLALCDQDGLSTLLNVHIGRDATGVDTLETAEGVAEYFNMQGVRVANPEKGLYIVRQNGKTSKVLMK